MAREKTVFSDVYHVWAQGKIQTGRNATGNRSINGPFAFSYAEPIGRIVNVRGQRIALMRDYSFSVTTSKMQSELRSATRHLTTFSVAHIGGASNWQSGYNATGKPAEFIDHKRNLNDYAARIKSAALAATKKRKYVESALNHVAALVSAANDYAATFGLKTRFSAPNVGDVAKLREREKTARARDDKRDELRRAAQEKRNAELTRERAEKLATWLTGANVTLPTVYSYGDVNATDYLRVVGGDVQTSRGAVVPLSHVRRAMRVVRTLIDNGRTFKANGHTIHVGAYTVDSVDESGNVSAGCHKFNRAEIIRFSDLLATLPDDNAAETE